MIARHGRCPVEFTYVRPPQVCGAKAGAQPTRGTVLVVVQGESPAGAAREARKRPKQELWVHSSQRSQR